MELIYQTLIRAFMQPAVLVLGDLMIDTYLRGASTRLSPEAPVPVVDISSHTSVLGGGANTAANLRHLGASVTFVSLIGDDYAAKLAGDLLAKEGIRDEVVRCATRTTMIKTRVIAGQQLLTRYDEGTEMPLDDACEAQLIAVLEREFPLHDAIVIADYNKGLLTPGIIATLERLNEQHRKFVAVDAKKLQQYKGLQPALAKPNFKEMMAMLQLPEQPCSKAQQLEEMGEAIYATTGAAITAVTLDEEGALIFQEDKLLCHTAARAVSNPNVSGAGDTYVSAFTLASLAGASPLTAAEIAGAAATVAIRKNNTAHCKQAELIAYFSMKDKYVRDAEELEALCDMYKAQGKKIVFTNGCFDILHSGHVSYLERAASLGDVLIVGVNTDESIKRLKGPERPINSLSDRVQVLAGLGAVSHLIAFGSEQDDTPESLIRIIKPSVFAKGGDYSRESLPEAAAVEEFGGEVVLLPLVPDRSTTLIIKRIYTTPALKVAEG
ncbi:D-glycero-beta-D-manno-heptose 1-phosphate adenylyltransferase [Chitinophaga filiformis]|uniref:D-glycero-beta-D-manno-heptose 1-phosphate adenylyltransferase n=1 Tax=Chitinophaga filiformis TaxID=104663 RepID=UPI001F43BBC3|nr:D-glycero-beta-D-manno-heptose 1-phosphate adenylyltransferase [Chitinophaga filiformis]MCF6407879.1 D-glycero-beta-D-manno-heptose 1-phosphate adenylyltransferase [Chitinophaga filiformis]